MAARGKSTRRHLISWAFAGALLTGCLSPTLPLPPPSPPSLTPPDDRGFTTLSGRVPAGTTAMAKNLANGKLEGEVTGESGGYMLQLRAATNDRIAIWYEDGYERSSSITVLVPAAAPASSALVDAPMGGAAGAGGD